MNCTKNGPLATSGMCKICAYHFLIDFTFLYRISDMPPNNRPIFPEQGCHLPLREPDGFALQRHGQSDLPVFRLKQHKLVLLVHFKTLSLHRFGRHPIDSIKLALQPKQQ